MDPSPFEEEYLGVIDPDEPLFARDLEARIIRMEKATLADLKDKVKLTVDGIAVEIEMAVPDIDDQGNVRLDENRFIIPRRTTIYDAANRAYTRTEDEG